MSPVLEQYRRRCLCSKSTDAITTTVFNAWPPGLRTAPAPVHSLHNIDDFFPRLCSCGDEGKRRTCRGLPAMSAVPIGNPVLLPAAFYRTVSSF